jgi:hypothetical protein
MDVRIYNELAGATYAAGSDLYDGINVRWIQ